MSGSGSAGGNAGGGMSGTPSSGSPSFGFQQSSNAFSGLTNTDLRPRRKKRPVPLLDTAWPINRHKGHAMRKDVTDLVGTLRASVLEIANSTADVDREALLNKSFGEFDAHLATLDLEPGLGELPPSGTGLDHINAFATGLGELQATIDAVFSGNPLRKRVITEAELDPSGMTEDFGEALELFMRMGELTLRKMVNDSVLVVETDEDAEAADADGTLAKIDTASGPILVKTALAEELRDYLTDPMALMLERADMGRELLGLAQDDAGELLEGEVIPPEVIDAYPEVFAPFGLEKAFPPGGFPPKKKPAPPSADQQASNTASTQGSPPDDDAGGSGGTGDGGEDEAVGGGAGDGDTGQQPSDITDDAPQNPLEMVCRLASIIVVIMGSLLQGQGGQGQEDTTQAGAGAGDAGNVGLQRGELIGDLRKIYAGEVEVDPELANELEELQRRRLEEPELAKALRDSAEQLQMLKATLARMQAAPAVPKGFLMQPVKKAEDGGGGTRETAEQVLSERVETLRKQDPQAAARLLIAEAHRQGGHSLLPEAFNRPG